MGEKFEQVIEAVSGDSIIITLRPNYMEFTEKELADIAHNRQRQNLLRRYGHIPKKIHDYWFPKVEK
jgi:hypothetical protein